MTALPPPPAGDPEATAGWVGAHLAGLWSAPLAASGRFRGGDGAAAAALAALDVAGYAGRRSEVAPSSRRGASGLSPYIRHNLLTLPEVWAAVEGGPARDVARFRDELMWQEYARHLYARVGRRSAAALRFEPAPAAGDPEPWSRDMACMELTLGELERDGWLVNQTRMWLASQWTVRHGRPWRDGEDHFFRHLLDGSRAANRLGWQWTVGAGTGKPYGFSRWQVEKRAPGTCAGCALRDHCPVQDRPPDAAPVPVAPDARLERDPDPEATAGPRSVLRRPGRGGPEAVWVTAESLGRADPALAAHPDRPAVFVFDAPLLERLQLSAKRLVFLAECLAELAADRAVELHRGDPAEVLAGRRLAATFAPVPGWRALEEVLDVVEVHPWPWLRRPTGGDLRSYSAWRRTLRP